MEQSSWMDMGRVTRVHLTSDPFLSTRKGKMTSHTLKAPRGRPPTGAVLQTTDEEYGRWVMTPEALEKAVRRLEEHRAACRNRYRNNRDTLKAQRPDLFIKKNGKRGRADTALRESQLPICDCILQGTEEERHPGEAKGLRNLLGRGQSAR